MTRPSFRWAVPPVRRIRLQIFYRNRDGTLTLAIEQISEPQGTRTQLRPSNSVFLSRCTCCGPLRREALLLKRRPRGKTRNPRSRRRSFQGTQNGSPPERQAIIAFPFRRRSLLSSPEEQRRTHLHQGARPGRTRGRKT